MEGDHSEEAHHRDAGAVALLLALFISPAKASDIPGANGQKLPYPLCITSAKASMNLGIPVTKRGALRPAHPQGRAQGLEGLRLVLHHWRLRPPDAYHRLPGYVPALDK